MASYEYKCVQAPAVIDVAKIDDCAEEVAAFANLINDVAIDGWEYYSMETIGIARTGIFGGVKDASQARMLIFRRERGGNE